MSRPKQDFFWYCLFSVKGLGPKRLHVLQRLLDERSLSPGDLLQLPPAELRDLLSTELSDTIVEQLQNLPWDELEIEFQGLQETGVQVVHLEHADYPALLHERLQDGAPGVLFCLGYLPLLRSDSVAIVGSRSASPRGLELAEQLAQTLALEGKNVISGFAKGVDTQAHLGALRAEGTTTIVLSSGIFDFVKRSSGDEVDWERNALALSQFHPCDHWSARNAMTRNKLVCAFSRAVIVIEAGQERDEDGKMSGTYQTAKTALDMGVPLFVISPRRLPDAPPGNAELIELGGTEFNPDAGLEPILTPAQSCTPHGQQQSLFG